MSLCSVMLTIACYFVSRPIILTSDMIVEKRLLGFSIFLKESTFWGTGPQGSRVQGYSREVRCSVETS